MSDKTFNFTSKFNIKQFDTMKKFLFLSIVVFAMTVVGCTSQPRDINKPNKVMMDKLPCDRVYEFKYKGHDYINFSDGLSNFSTDGYVHSPDCSNENCVKMRTWFKEKQKEGGEYVGY